MPSKTAKNAIATKTTTVYFQSSFLVGHDTFFNSWTTSLKNFAILPGSSLKNFFQFIFFLAGDEGVFLSCIIFSIIAFCLNLVGIFCLAIFPCSLKFKYMAGLEGFG